MRVLCSLLLATLAGACGNSEAGETSAPDISPTASSPTNASASEASVIGALRDDGASAGLMAGSGEGSQVQPDARSPQAPAAGALSGGAVAQLPLRLGFYVSSDVTCATASNATLQLLGRDGINTSRVPCSLDRIEQVDATRYRVTSTCTEGGPAWGTEESVETSSSIYEILSETSFKRIYEDGWESTMNHCPQSTLPEPWRDNDISDLID